MFGPSQYRTSAKPPEAVTSGNALGVLYSQSPSCGVLAIACVLEERVEKLNIQNHGQVGSPVLMRGRIEIRLSYPVVKCNELGRQPS